MSDDSDIEETSGATPFVEENSEDDEDYDENDVR